MDKLIELRLQNYMITLFNLRVSKLNLNYKSQRLVKNAIFTHILCHLTSVKPTHLGLDLSIMR
jgi:hypothetical protein